MRKKLNQWLEKLSQRQLLGLSMSLCGGIGLFDYAIRIDLSLSIFYLIPIAIAAWYGDRHQGIFLAVLSSLVWLCADITAKRYPAVFLPIWNFGIRLGFFGLVSYLISLQQGAYKREIQLARIDGLTGIYNRRFFIEMLEIEMARSRRYHFPFAIAYLDIDNFKTVNDRFGHKVGDRLLQTIIKQLQTSLRENDILGRLGGDEFAILLPQMEAAQAHSTLLRIHAQLNAAVNPTWAIGFSVGAVAYTEMPNTVDEIITLADEIMYEIKKSGKNRVGFKVAKQTTPNNPVI